MRGAFLQCTVGGKKKTKMMGIRRFLLTEFLDSDIIQLYKIYIIKPMMEKSILAENLKESCRGWKCSRGSLGEWIPEGG